MNETKPPLALLETIAQESVTMGAGLWVRLGEGVYVLRGTSLLPAPVEEELARALSSYAGPAAASLVRKMGPKAALEKVLSSLPEAERAETERRLEWLRALFL